MLGAAILNNGTNRDRQPAYGYKETIVASHKVNWQIEDIIGGDRRLNFSNRFLPEPLARVEKLSFLDEGEKKVLNQIRAHAYLCIFGLVEEFILPFVLDHVRPSLDQDDYRVRAFLQFAGEEAKHIQLFKLFSEDFRQRFGTECEVIGPASAVANEVLRHDPLAVALAILHIEWMTQRHYIESVRDDHGIDQQFKSLLKNHWLEEAQHAKLDTAMVLTLAETMDKHAIESAVDEYLEIGGFLDNGVRQQTMLDLDAFQRATGRTLTEEERDEFIDVQHQANRWTYIGSGMTHPKFLDALGQLDPEQKDRIEAVAPMFC